VEICTTIRTCNGNGTSKRKDDALVIQNHLHGLNTYKYY